MGMRNIAPFGLRMPAELRDKLEVAAKESRRSLNSEILERIARSFEARQYSAESGNGAVAPRVESPAVATYRPDNDYEIQLIAEFRRLTPDKQLALLTLLR